MAPTHRSPRRTQILAAAARLFARHGFHGVSVDDLGAATGISGPALYRHFRAKEEILTELLTGASARLLDGGRARVEAAAVPAEALGALVAFHVDFALDNPDVITVQARELANLPSTASREVRALQHRYVTVWADVIDAACCCGHETAVVAAHAAFGLMNSTPHSARLARPQMERLLREMALGAVGACGCGDRPTPQGGRRELTRRAASAAVAKERGAGVP
jgi:AcrR family transcriptional regulator